jgi:hypothetical protein
MRARVWVALAAAAATLAAAVALVFWLSAPSPRAGHPGARSRGAASRSAASRGAASRGARSRVTVNHVVSVSEHGTGRSASLTITDPYAAGSKLRKAEYHLRDGYTKRVIIPGGAYVVAEDIAICGEAGKHYPDNGFTGTGLPCKPALHPVEVRYHQRVGDLAGRYRPHRHVEVTEISHGSGRYLTVGHIDHGTLQSVEYYWANGEHLTLNLPGDVLVDHIRLVTEGGRLGAVATRHG